MLALNGLLGSYLSLDLKFMGILYRAYSSNPSHPVSLQTYIFTFLILLLADVVAAWKHEAIISSGGLVTQRKAKTGHDLLAGRLFQSSMDTHLNWQNYSGQSNSLSETTSSENHSRISNDIGPSLGHERDGASVHGFLLWTTCFIFVCCLPLCFALGYQHAQRRKTFEDDISSSSGSSSDELEENKIEDGVIKAALIPRKPQNTAKDLGLLAWLPSTRASALVCDGPSLNLEILDPEWSASQVREILSTYGLPVRNWSESALADLARELGKCKARFFRKEDTLLRVVDMVIVIMVHKEEGTVIQELSHPPYRRGFATIRERTPKGRMLINECITTCAKRCLREKLQVPDGMLQDLKLDVLSITENLECFDHMPGLPSIVRNYVVQVNVSASSVDDLDKIGAPHGRLEIEGYRYTWLKIKEATNLRKHLKKESSKKMKLKKQKVVLDSSAEPVLAWSEAEVLKHLAEAGMSREHAESLWNADLKTLVERLRNGQLSLARGEVGRGLLCVEDTVVLYSRSKDDMVLVQSKSNKLSGRAGLPSTRKFANESAWAASFRMSFLSLGILSPNFRIAEEANAPVKSDEEAASGYIKRKFIVHAHLDENVPPTLASAYRCNDADDDMSCDAFESES